MKEISVYEEIKKDVSVIIVNWNTKDLILSCVRSIITETKEVSLEIIVVDNASTDGSQDALKKEFPEVILIQNDENLGFAKANNIGIKKCTGEYICLVNSDVEVKSRCIDNMKSYMDENQDIGLMGPKIYLPDGGIQESCKRFPSLINYFYNALFFHRIFPNSKTFNNDLMKYIDRKIASDVDAIIGAFWFTNRNALEQVGLLDETFFFYGEDIDWCKRFWNKNFRVVYFPGSEIIHYTGSSSSNTPIRYHIQLYRAYLQYWKKHYSHISLVLLKYLLMLHQIIRVIFRSILFLTSSGNKGKNAFKVKRSIACLFWLSKTPLRKI